MPFGYAAADIAPDPLTAGGIIKSYDEEITEVRMVEEEVVILIYDNKIVTVADFSMFNEGETVSQSVSSPKISTPQK
jgi:hypothetical protein